MATGKDYENLSTEKLKKLLLSFIIFAVVGAITSITVVALYLLYREDNVSLALAGAGLGSVTVLISIIATRIKEEIKKRQHH